MLTRTKLDILTGAGAQDDVTNRVRRSASARCEITSCMRPATGSSTGACPRYVINHIKALKRGGPDIPSNMRWQTIAAAQAKDRVE